MVSDRGKFQHTRRQNDRVAHEVAQIARNCGETQIWKWVEPPMVQVQHLLQHTHSLTVLNVFSQFELFSYCICATFFSFLINRYTACNKFAFYKLLTKKGLSFALFNKFHISFCQFCKGPFLTSPIAQEKKIEGPADIGPIDTIPLIQQIQNKLDLNQNVLISHTLKN